MKQTAVEWLEEMVDNMIMNGGDSDLLAVIEHIQQAKAMEKEQIIRAHLMARCYDDANSYNEAEQYYNEIYNK